MEQIETVRREFTKQAKNLEAYQTIFSKAEFNALAIEQMRLTGKERALEVAAGTCAFGRAIAPHVARITESDATKAILKNQRQKKFCGKSRRILGANGKYAAGGGELSSPPVNKSKRRKKMSLAGGVDIPRGLAYTVSGS